MYKNLLLNSDATATGGSNILDQVVEQTVNGVVQRRPVSEWVKLASKGEGAESRMQRAAEAEKAAADKVAALEAENAQLKALKAGLEGFKNKDPDAIRTVARAIGADSDETEALIAGLTGDDLENPGAGALSAAGPLPMSLMPKPLQDMVAAAKTNGIDPGTFLDMMAKNLERNSAESARDIVAKSLDSHPKFGKMVRSNPKAREAILKDAFAGVTGRVQRGERFGEALIREEFDRVSSFLDSVIPNEPERGPSPFIGVGANPVGSRPSALHPAERPRLTTDTFTKPGGMADYINQMLAHVESDPGE